MRPLWSMGLLLSLGVFASQPSAASSMSVDVALYWEGRELQEPNREALERFRKEFPDVPLTHFINPIYVLNEKKSSEFLADFRKLAREDDEVGLYLAPMEPLVKEAGVIPKLAPSFWGSRDEGDICDGDCGLDVPMTVYDREDAMRIVTTAHRGLTQAGFENLKSFAVRGWLDAPFITQFAAALGYRHDFSAIDPTLLAPKLREFPLYTWVKQRWGMLMESEPDIRDKVAHRHPTVHLVLQGGGVLELNEQSDILARFERQAKWIEEHSDLDEPFTLALSVESAFQSAPRLRALLQSLGERAKKLDIRLRYATVSGVKNSRPLAINMRISTKFSQQLEGSH